MYLRNHSMQFGSSQLKIRNEALDDIWSLLAFLLLDFSKSKFKMQQIHVYQRLVRDRPFLFRLNTGLV